jgi:23S rRNA pseudouridine2605 synthase
MQGVIPNLEARFSLTSEQLEASRAERMRHNGLGAVTLEDARTWLEETGLCLFLPRRQFSAFVAPSFVEAVAGERNFAPAAKTVTLAEELLIRLEADGVAVRLNLLGQPGEQPDFIVAAWVLPYVYALRGDRDWRRSPQLTGSRQVSPLAIQAYKLLEAGDATISQLRHALGREVTESAVLRAITELWQQLRIIPVISAPGKPAQWQLLRLRFQKAIAEGASTSQVTAISVLASIYLQAVIAASMEEVELFLAALTARSKIREVLRGLVATRQVHTISLGHAPHYYVAGTLPEFASAPTAYARSAMPASTYFLRSYEREEAQREPVAPAPFATAPSSLSVPEKAAELPQPRGVERTADAEDKAPVALPRLSRQPAPSRSRKPGQSAAGSRAARHPGRNMRGGSARSATPHANGSPRRGHAARWAQGAAKNSRGKRGPVHPANGSSGPGRFRANGNGHANGASKLRKTKPAASSTLRNGHSLTGKSAGKPVSRRGSAPRSEVRIDKHGARGNHKPALTASAKAGNRGRYGFTAPSRQRSKKRG